jgi:hypothetical protein
MQITLSSTYNIHDHVKAALAMLLDLAKPQHKTKDSNDPQKGGSI